MDIEPRFVQPSYKTFTLDPSKLKANKFRSPRSIRSSEGVNVWPLDLDSSVDRMNTPTKHNGFERVV